LLVVLNQLVLVGCCRFNFSRSNASLLGSGMRRSSSKRVSCFLRGHPSSATPIQFVETHPTVIICELTYGRTVTQHLLRIPGGSVREKVCRAEESNLRTASSVRTSVSVASNTTTFHGLRKYTNSGFYRRITSAQNPEPWNLPPILTPTPLVIRR
jgi:hypothetical protein